MMRILTTAVACVTWLAALGQDDSVRFIHGLPITGEDTIREALYRTPPVDSSQRIQPDEIPPRLLRALDKHDIFRGWRRGKIYFDREAKLYRVFIRTGDVTRAYGLDERGNTISYDEFNNNIDQ